MRAYGSALADSGPQKGVGWGRSSEDDLLPHCARSETRRRTGSGSTAREREPTTTSMRVAVPFLNSCRAGRSRIGEGHRARLASQTPFFDESEG